MACAMLVSSLIGVLLPINIVGSEIVARTSPNLIDLRIAIAAGAAGSFSLTRKSIASSIAGVAIAVALVPPLCVVGIGLGIGDSLAGEIGRFTVTNLNVSAGAFLLFLANWAGITFTACLVFLSQSYGNLNKAFQSLLIWLLIMALLCGPLTNSLQEFLLGNRIDVEIHQIRKDKPEFWQKTQIRHISGVLEGTTLYLTILLTSPEGLLTEEYLDYVKKRLFDSVSNMGVKAMDLDIRIIPVRIREYESIIERN